MCPPCRRRRIIGLLGGGADINAPHQQLQTAGARIWQAPRAEPWAMRSLIVGDFDDNLICFASNLTGASERL
jgi:hypothetical protein